MIQKRRLGIIDCGTNTFNLLIGDAKMGPKKPLFKARYPVKLLHRSKNGEISPEGFERGLAALKQYRIHLSEWDTTTYKVVGTEGLRSATNGQDFLQSALEQTGLRIELINGQEEANLIYQGVQQIISFNHNPALIMDIGGGSTEFILANDAGIIWKQSFPLGAAALINQLKPADPIDTQDKDKIHSFLRDQLTPLYKVAIEIKPKVLIGSSGSFDSLADILEIRKKGKALDSDQRSYHFSLNTLNSLLEELACKSLEERLKIEGLISMRADMIGMGAIFIQMLLRDLNIHEMKRSAFALKEGLFWNLAHNLV